MTVELARKVMAAFRLLGFDPHLNDLESPRECAGLIVEIGEPIDREGLNRGLFVYWQSSEAWATSVYDALQKDDMEAPVFLMDVDIQAGILEMLSQVLTGAGFQVARAGDYRDMNLLVTGVRGETIDELVRTPGNERP